MSISIASWFCLGLHHAMLAGCSYGTEQYEDMITAIGREKQIKAGSRKRKLALIEASNPDWRDLYEDLL